MDSGVVLLAAGLWMLVGILPGIAIGRFAVFKGKDFWPWFWGGALFAWPFAAILLMLMPTPGTQPRPRAGSPLSARQLKQLEDLSRLQRSGALTEQEFEREKAKLLGHPPAPTAPLDHPASIEISPAATEPERPAP